MKKDGLVLLLALSSFLSACLAGCSSSSGGGKHPREGVRYTIVCKYFMQQCYFRANDRCEGRSYKLLSTNETMKTGGPQGRYREFSMQIQCN